MRILIALILIIPSISYAERTIGRITGSEGLYSKTNLNCNDGSCRRKKSLIYPGDRIRTSKNGKVRILLNDNTALIIFSSTDIIINNARARELESPTRMQLDKGKIRVLQKNSYFDTSLIIRTPASVIKSVNSELSIVSSEEETALFVYTGEAGFAGINPSKDRAYILKSGDESFVSRESEPVPPVKVARTLQDSWLGRHIISQDSKRIIIYKKESGPADWPFIRKD